MKTRRIDEMTRGIDRLAKAMPNGQLFAAMGPLAFLGAAADHIEKLEAEHAAEFDRRTGPARDFLTDIIDDTDCFGASIPDSARKCVVCRARAALSLLLGETQ